MTNRVAASELRGGIEIARERDIRRRGRPFNDMIECDPVHCACCGRAIYKIAELRNGDIIGSECACIIPNSPIMRMGRFLNKRQQEYARRNNLLPTQPTSIDRVNENTKGVCWACEGNEDEAHTC